MLAVSTGTPALLVLPFALLLIMIGSGPVLYAHLWHRFYPWVCVSLAGLVIGYYIIHGDMESVEHSAKEYIQFIALIGALYVATSGIELKIHTAATAGAGLSVLWLGA